MIDRADPAPSARGSRTRARPFAALRAPRGRRRPEPPPARRRSRGRRSRPAPARPALAPRRRGSPVRRVERGSPSRRVRERAGQRERALVRVGRCRLLHRLCDGCRHGPAAGAAAAAHRRRIEEREHDAPAAQRLASRDWSAPSAAPCRPDRRFRRRASRSSTHPDRPGCRRSVRRRHPWPPGLPKRRSRAATRGRGCVCSPLPGCRQGPPGTSASSDCASDTAGRCRSSRPRSRSAHRCRSRSRTSPARARSSRGGARLPRRTSRRPRPPGSDTR